MQELSYKEVRQVSGGEQYSDWEVIAIASAASGLAFAGIKAYKTWSILRGAPLLVACAIPTAIMSTMIVGTVQLTSWAMGSGKEAQHVE
tara:strand:+ start:92042 stop:92308 length:267 start_codon:yes stop_codon:yes gene_type:complete